MKKFLVPILIFAAIGLLLAYGLKLDPRKIPSPLIDKPLPAFTLPTLDGAKTLTHVDLRGRVVLINVWASWCGACKDEHPLLMKIAAQKAVPLVGLNYKDEKNPAQAVLRQDGNPYDLILMDKSGRTGIDWGVYGVPETFLIDQQGVIRYKHIGPLTPQAWNDTLLPMIQRMR